jgi:hypothetical protein
MSTRRRLLAVAGAATVTATAGCMSALGSDEPDAANDAAASSGGEPSVDGARIERLAVRNTHEAAHRVQLAVELADGVGHLDTYELDPGGGTVVEGDWTSTAGDYVVHARLDDGEIRSTDVTASVSEDTDCVRMVLRIDQEGGLGILFGTNCDP